MQHENWNFAPRRLSGMPWYSEADAPDGVPVLDLAVLLDGGKKSAARRSELAALREAVTRSGFIYIKNHGITDAEIEAISNQSRAFYAQPEEYKRRFDHHQVVRGYTSYRFESTARFFGTGRGKDLCMKYTMGPELSPEEVRQRIGSEEDRASNAYSTNVFPSSGFRDAWARYYDRVHHTSVRLLEVLGEALALAPESRRVWTEMLVEKSCGELRYLQYPDVPRRACSGVPGTLPERMAAHFDLDVITLLHQTPCANGFVSLQARIGEQFVDIPAIRGTLVVNLGEVIRLLTGGRIKATIHRVVRPPQSHHRGSARDVIVFFQAPPLNAQLRPLVFAAGVGHETLFDELYRAAGASGSVTFSRLRARLFGEFIRQMNCPDEQYERDAHLFLSPDEERCREQAAALAR